MVYLSFDTMDIIFPHIPKDQVLKEINDLIERGVLETVSLHSRPDFTSYGYETFNLAWTNNIYNG